VLGGERINSIRTLMQRPFPYQSLTLSTTGAAALWFFRWMFPIQIPWSVATSAQPGVASANWFPAMWLTQMYVGWRGSIRNKFVPFGSNGTGSILMVAASHIPAGQASLNTNAVFTGLNFPAIGDCGWNVNTPYGNNAVEVSTPYYREPRYLLSRLCWDGSGSSLVENVGFTMLVKPSTSEAYLAMRWISVGDDFSVGRFRFVPRVYLT
jgi:hypothetical protein